MESVIKIQNLYKSYGKNSVLKGISFDVKKGETFALLGTNGAGKTTTLECIEELRKYDEGETFIDGKFGVQLQSTSLPENIKVIEALTLFSKWNDCKLDNDFSSRIGLDTIKNKQYVELSTGQKRKLHLAIVLIGNPDIIFLDEPTAGLDVEGRIVLHDEIRRLKGQGKTIVMASHDMAEVEDLCDTIAILKDGKIAFIGSPEELTMQVSSVYTMHLKLSENISFFPLTTCVYKETIQDYSIFETSNIGDSLSELLIIAKVKKVQIYDLKIEHPSLERRFMEIAKEGK